MFSLWYTLLSWKEYKERIASKQKTDPIPAAESKVELEVPQLVPDPVKSVDPNENISPLPAVPQYQHQSTPKSVPSSQNTVIETSFPGSIPQEHLSSIPKPPRSPSPHPMRTEVYDIEFDSEESEQYDDEDEEQDSVISKPSNIEEFLSTEINGLKRESS